MQKPMEILSMVLVYAHQRPMKSYYCKKAQFNAIYTAENSHFAGFIQFEAAIILVLIKNTFIPINQSIHKSNN